MLFVEYNFPLIGCLDDILFFKGQHGFNKLLGFFKLYQTNFGVFILITGILPSFTTFVKVFLISGTLKFYWG